ncbi:hypothetical protein IFM89_009413, partial [Coptis chinensis]
ASEEEESGSKRKPRAAKAKRVSYEEPNSSEKTNGDTAKTSKKKRVSKRKAKPDKSSCLGDTETDLNGSNSNDNKSESTMCHQCQRNDRGPVVRCMKCKTERYCHECLNWYPHLSHTEVARSCPVCRGNCNCKQCLRSKGNSKEKSKSERKVIEDEKINYSKYLLHQLLPVLKEIDQEQVMEKEVEARIRGNLHNFLHKCVLW